MYHYVFNNKKGNKITVMALKQKVTCFILVTHRIIRENKIFYATCPELEVSSQGHTIEKADKNLMEAVLCYLDTIEELGIREEVFRQKNIVLYKSKENAEDTKIDTAIVPGEFITANSIPIAC